MILLPVFVFAVWLRQIFRPVENFSGYRDRLVIVQSAMHYSRTDEKCGTTISVIGTVRNDTDVSWKDIYFEARYFDLGGTMIDTESAEQYGVVIPAHEEVAFRVRGAAIRPEQDYASHKVVVLSAKDASSRF